MVFLKIVALNIQDIFICLVFVWVLQSWASFGHLSMVLFLAYSTQLSDYLAEPGNYESNHLSEKENNNSIKPAFFLVPRKLIAFFIFRNIKYYCHIYNYTVEKLHPVVFLGKYYWIENQLSTTIADELLSFARLILYLILQNGHSIPQLDARKPVLLCTGQAHAIAMLGEMHPEGWKSRLR